MLPRQHRITKPAEFSKVTRRGRKTRRGCLLAYSLAPNATTSTPSGSLETSGSQTEEDSARVGLIVSRGVGNSVVRHRVSRVLRHQMREHISSFDPGTMLIIRALPGAGSRSNAAVARDLRLCLDSTLGGSHA